MWAADVLLCSCFDSAQHDMDVAHEDVHYAQQLNALTYLVVE